MSANLFLVAAPRAGSTQLAAWLNSHADIGLSQIKEPNHFSADEFSEEYVAATHLNDVVPGDLSGRKAQFAVIRSSDTYAKIFSKVSKKWRLDASTTYLACTEAPGRIRKYQASAKIILLTRTPLERAISHYKLAIRTGRITASLGDTLAAELAAETPTEACFLLRPSLTREGIAAFKAVFPVDQVLELKFEKLIDEPENTLLRIADFLNIDPGGFDLSVQARNQSMPPRFSTLNRWLYTTGLKTKLRRILPAEVKAMLKPIYFAKNRPIKITDAEIDALDAALAVSA